jgi:FkbM family methyltransferase
MKTFIIKSLHRVLGYSRYLEVFSTWKIRLLFLDRRKSDFLFFTQALPADATVAVIGACTGITTVPFAKGYPLRKVFAYEPEPASFAALNAVVRQFGLQNVSTHCLALGNETGTRQFILPVVDGIRKQGIAHMVDPSITEYNEGISEDVAICRFDELPELQDVRLTAVKLVAENFEYEVLAGAKATLQRDRPLIYCELWHNDKRQRVHDLIRSYGYAIYYRRGKQLLPYDPDSYTGKNFFFRYDHA